jgi:hypothetical protein
VFSKVGRSLLPDEVDKFTAEVFDPVTPKDVPFQGDTLAHNMEQFFGLDSLAKVLYAKLNIDTAEEID